MRKPGFQLRHIEGFLAIVQSGGIRSAARMIGISQPALTKTLRELETILAVPLVSRSASGVALTPYGKAFYLRAIAVSEELDRAKGEIAQMLDSEGGDVVIGISPLASLMMGADILKRFWRTHPMTNLKLVEGLFEVLVTGVEQGRFDFSIGPIPSRATHSSTIVVEPLFYAPIMPVVRPDHPLAGAKSLADLKNGKWLFTSVEKSIQVKMAEAFASAGLEFPRIAVICESFPAAVELVRQTDLIAALSPILFRQKLFRDHLKVIQIKETTPSTINALIRKAGVPLTPRAEVLAQEFRKLGKLYSKATVQR